uniref:Uncharacterized protein n=1 Tax=Arundo donax TaxID=35708 RepID=A0A0A9FJQ9_ARUDO
MANVFWPTVSQRSSPRTAQMAWNCPRNPPVFLISFLPQRKLPLYSSC